MKIHEQDMSSSLFKDVKDLKPVIRSTSDSGALDNVFELLTHSGKLAPLIKLMMIPDHGLREVKQFQKIIKIYLIFLIARLNHGMVQLQFVQQMPNGF